MPIKLLATDLDGTLVPDLNTIPPRTQAAVRAAVERGVRVVIATGREYEITRHFVQLLGLTDPIICYQGALIYDPHTGQPIAREGLSLTTTHALIDQARGLGLALNLFLNGKAYTEHLTDQSWDFYSRVGTALVQVDDLKQVFSIPAIKAIIVHPPAEAETVTGHLRQTLGPDVKIFHSQDALTEVTAARVSKGSALQTLATYYTIPQEEVMAIGDHDNDVEMIAWAGLGVAMGNASAKARAVAKVIAPPLNEEGAAWAIEHFILNASSNPDEPPSAKKG